MYRDKTVDAIRDNLIARFAEQPTSMHASDDEVAISNLLMKLDELTPKDAPPYTTVFHHKYKVGDEVKIYPLRSNNLCIPVRIKHVRYRSVLDEGHIVTYDLEHIDAEDEKTYGGYDNYPEAYINEPNH